MITTFIGIDIYHCHEIILFISIHKAYIRLKSKSSMVLQLKLLRTSGYPASNALRIVHGNCVRRMKKR